MTIIEMVQKKEELRVKAHAIVDAADAEKREITIAERREIDKMLTELKAINKEIEAGGGFTPGRQTTLQTMDSLSDVRKVKPGEFRLLAKNEKVADVYGPTTKAEKAVQNIDLGKYIRAASGMQPDNAELEIKCLAGNIDASGGILIPAIVANDIIDVSRNKTTVILAGANTYMMSSSKELLPKIVQDITGQWVPENTESTDSQIAFGGIELQARTFRFWLPISNELWQDASQLGTWLMAAIGEAVALELDRAALFGSGDGETPQGLYYDPDISQTAVAHSQCYDDLSDSIYRLENANITPTATIMSPRSKNYVRKIKDGEGNYQAAPVWMPPIYTTKQIPDTLSATSNKSAVITGDFTNLIIGIRNNLQITVLKEVKAQRNQVVIMGTLRADVAAIRPSAFDILKDVGAEWMA